MKFWVVTGLISICALVLAPLAFSPPVYAHHCVGGGGADHGAAGSSIGECLDAGACLDTAGAGCTAQNGSKDKVNSILRTVINVLSIVGGIAAVIMIIVGGLKYVTSGGESSNLTGAKSTILYAVIGLIVVALAQIVVKFVLNKATADPEPAVSVTRQIETRVLASSKTFMV